MEKVTINNEVVLMRKFVKQAKIRAINGYTKEIRKLQNRKGSDDATSKFKRKAERLLAKVAILRKIHPDTVSRKALAKEKDWNAVLKEKNIPLEDQCYALLANYAAVQSEVERFHKKYWDLVPKMPTFFKDWEEKSKDPISKQEKKKAKQLRKSMKNVKLDKNNPNAIPVGLNKDTDTMKNKSTSNNSKILTKSITADSKKIKNEFDERDLKQMSSTVVQNNSVMKEEISNNESETKVLVPLKKSQLHVKYKQPKPTANLLNKVEKIEGENKSYHKYNADEKEANYGEEIKSDEEEIKSDEEDIKSDEEEIKSSEEEMNSDEEERNSNKEVDSDKEDFGKSPLKLKPNEITEAKNEDLKMSSGNDVGSNSENSNLEKNDVIFDSDNDLKSFVGTTQSETINKKVSVPKSNLKTLKSGNNPQDIQSRLKAMADNRLKSDIKRKKPKKTNSNKPASENKLKAVAMLNLNELLGLDEFLVEKSNNVVEETGETKRKKDPFFLGKGGEVISESEDEDSASPFQAKDRPAFKKKKMDDFAKNSNGDSFKRRSFAADSSQNSRSSFRKNGFSGNHKNSHFEDGNNSFKNREQRRFELKNKGFQNKSFGEKFPSKQFKSNANTETRNKDTFLKNKSNISSNKNPVEEKPLHPSWEAKKKLKEAASSKFQGKRIVFND